jgi:hypothetical protein
MHTTYTTAATASDARHQQQRHKSSALQTVIENTLTEQQQELLDDMNSRHRGSRGHSGGASRSISMSDNDLQHYEENAYTNSQSSEMDQSQTATTATAAVPKPLTPLQREQRRRRQSMAKLRRVSVGLATRSSQGLSERMSLLGLSKLNTSSSLSQTYQDHNSSMTAATASANNSTIDHQQHVSPSLMGSRRQSFSDTLPLSSANFNMKVLCGTYNNQFWNGLPIVTTAAVPSEKRVVRVEVGKGQGRISKGSVKLFLCTTATARLQEITLPPNGAYAIMVHPTGILISRKPLLPGTDGIAYYVAADVINAAVGLLDKLRMQTVIREDSMIREEDEEDSNSNSSNYTDNHGDVDTANDNSMDMSALLDTTPLREGSATAAVRDSDIDRLSISPVGNCHTTTAETLMLGSHDTNDAQQEEHCEEHSIVNVSCSSMDVTDNNIPRPTAMPVQPALLSAVLAWVGPNELASASAVSITWATAVAYAQADILCAQTEALSSIDNNSSSSSKASTALTWKATDTTTRFPWGCYLAEGAFKQVYKVYNVARQRQEAMSVMNVQAITDAESGAVIAQELRMGVLASSLVRRRICPNFVETYGFFRCSEAPCISVWGSATNKAPLGIDPILAIDSSSANTVANKKAAGRKGKASKAIKGTETLRYQYIGMELCESGDIEEYIRAAPDTILPLQQVMPMLFQMIFSLFAGRHEYSMRHYDIKLLNFLVRI